MFFRKHLLFWCVFLMSSVETLEMFTKAHSNNSSESALIHTQASAEPHSSAPSPALSVQQEPDPGSTQPTDRVVHQPAVTRPPLNQAMDVRSHTETSQNSTSSATGSEDEKTDVKTTQYLDPSTSTSYQDEIHSQPLVTGPGSSSDQNFTPSVLTTLPPSSLSPVSLTTHSPSLDLIASTGHFSSTMGPILTDKSTSTLGPILTDKSTSTMGPILTDKSTSTMGPILTDKSTSTMGPISTRTSISTMGPILTDKSTSTLGPILTDKSTSTMGPISTTEFFSTMGPISTNESSSASSNLTSAESTTAIGPFSTNNNVSTTRAIVTTANPTNSSGVLIPKIPRRNNMFPSSTTTFPTTSDQDKDEGGGPLSCPKNRREGLVNLCLIAIVSLAGLTTIFMVSTIILCTKLSSRKRLYKMRDGQQDTEMVCISALMPEINREVMGRSRIHKANRGLRNGGELDSDDGSAGDLTLHSFLPDNDRVV